MALHYSVVTLCHVNSQSSAVSTNVDEITKPCFPLRLSTQIIISIHIQLHLIYRE